MKQTLQKIKTMFLLFSLSILTTNVFASGTTLYSIAAGGSWSANASWSNTSGGASCSCTPISLDSVNIETDITLDQHLDNSSGIGGAILINSGLTMDGGSTYNVSVKNGGYFHVYGTVNMNDLTFENGSHIYVAPGGVLNVNGNFSNNNANSDVTIDGTLNITGSAYNGNGAYIGGTGSINPSSAFTGSGTMSSSIALLPVELVSFDAKSINKNVLINWTTASEKNNDYFTIERTKDSRAFETITTTKGAGNSNTLLYYNATDESPMSGTSYYRLKQTDYNGHFSYSNLVPLNIDSKTEFNVYPNPSNGTTDIIVSLKGAGAKEILVVVYDLTGREAYSKVTPVFADDKFIIASDASNKLSPGVYMVKASSKEDVYNQKLVIK